MSLSELGTKPSDKQARSEAAKAEGGLFAELRYTYAKRKSEGFDAQAEVMEQVELVEAWAADKSGDSSFTEEVDRLKKNYIAPKSSGCCGGEKSAEGASGKPIKDLGAKSAETDEGGETKNEGKTTNFQHEMGLSNEEAAKLTYKQDDLIKVRAAEKVLNKNTKGKVFWFSKNSSVLVLSSTAFAHALIAKAQSVSVATSSKAFGGGEEKDGSGSGSGDAAAAAPILGGSGADAPRTPGDLTGSGASSASHTP